MERSDGAAAGVATDRDELLRRAIERARQGTFYAKHLAGYALSGRADLGRLPLTFKTICATRHRSACSRSRRNAPGTTTRPAARPASRSLPGAD